MSELINSKSMFSEERVSEIKEIQRDISVKRLKKKDIPNSIKVMIFIGVKNERREKTRQKNVKK